MTHHYSDADTSAILCMFPDTKRVAYRMQDWVDSKVVSVSGWLYNGLAESTHWQGKEKFCIQYELLLADILRCWIDIFLAI